jgi:hypothetical protein
MLSHASCVDFGSTESFLVCLNRNDVPVKLVLPVAGWLDVEG